jgi:NitT/TauT family transport system substrate-binding protein
VFLMMSWLSGLRAAGAVAACGLALAACGQKSETKGATAAAPAGEEVAIGWTIYAGWMPLPYAQQSGIVDKWNKKYGTNIKLVQINDYVESLNQFTAGKLTGVTSTNMDALTIPAAGGKDTTFVVVGDYSNGNDGIVLKGGTSLAQIKGRSVNFPEFSVSHYLVARGLEKAGLKPSDVKVINTSDADIVAAFGAPETSAVAAWNPMLAEIKAMPNATEVFNSKEIPGEILDGIIVSTEALAANPNLGKALAGIWYETMALMKSGTPEGQAALEAMAKLSGTDLPGYQAQLDNTFLYDKPQAYVDFISSTAAVEAMDRVRQFSFANGLFGQGAKSVDAIGIAFPGGKVLGDPNNVKLRFDTTYAAAAAAGSL